MLLFLILAPIFGAVIVLFIKRSNFVLIRNFSLLWSLILFNSSIYLYLTFDPTTTKFQCTNKIEWLNVANNHFVFGIDGLALLMILLTAFLIPICIMLSWKLKNPLLTKEYVIIFLSLESILNGVFSSLDLLVFYILFEAVLIPMYFLIGVFGSRERKIKASYLLFLYTLFSSIIMFIAILFLYSKFGTTNYLILAMFDLDPFTEKLCWLAFFFSFAVKMPMIPFHVWLPEAHCEAPTAGSILLAGILLKLGGYGFLRFSLVLFPNASAFFTPFVFLLSLVGVIYASVSTLQQVDLKKIIAYSSVSHMGLVTIGIFSNNIQGIIGSVFLMIGHGITSSALFLAVGLLYDRYGTRVVKYYGGLANTMPLFASCFLLFSMANIGLPITSNFIGEFFCLVACFKINSLIAFLAGFGVVLSAGYSLWLSNRILFGNLKQTSITVFRDLNRKEFALFFPFVFLTFFLGIFPDPIIDIIKSTWLF